MAPERYIPSNAPRGACTFTVLTEGKEVSRTHHLLSIVVNKEINRIPSATLVYIDGDVSKQTFELSSKGDFEPGKKIEIQVGYSGKEDSIFKGVVVKHGIKVKGGSSLLVVECRDEAMKMTVSTRNKYNADKKDSEIIEDLIGKHGLQKDVEATKVKHEELVQYEATDWDFMMCRAEMNGMLCIPNDGKISVAKPKFSGEPILKILYGATIYDLDAEVDARFQYKSVKATAWSPADQKLVDGIEGEKAQTPKAGNFDSDKLADVAGEKDFMLQHTGNLKDQELQQWANSMMLKHSLAMVRGSVRTDGFAKILPGKLIELKGVGDRFEGKLFVTGVRHEIGNGAWYTVTQFGVNPEWFAQSYKIEQPLSGALLPAIQGLHIGVVTKMHDDPAKEHRIRVRLPIISTSEDGVWSRISTLDAGKERGTFFRPEVGDEVIVGFLNNDPRHPIVLGMCHSSNKPVPVTAEEHNYQKGYWSREKIKMTFDDDPKSFTVETPAHNKLLMTDKDKTIELSDQNGNKITMNDKGITIESEKGDIMIKTSKGKINTDSASTSEIKAAKKVTVTGNGADLLGNGGNATVKGVNVMIN